MKKYEKILDNLLRSIHGRDGRTPTELAEKYRSATEEGMMREGICQVLAQENAWVKWKTLILHPTLVVPYLSRIRRTKEAKK